jgi:archaemetzincin
LPDVIVVPVGASDPSLLEYLALTLGEAMKLEARMDARRLIPDFAYDPVRRQFESTRILTALVEDWGTKTKGKILGVAECDLFIPILTFVFGEAQLGGRGAVISLARLRQTFYGLPDDPSVLYHRAEKEAIHEVGHTFGLVHCQDYGCVMHFSNSVEDVDLKGDRFCSECAARIPHIGSSK